MVVPWAAGGGTDARLGGRVDPLRALCFAMFFCVTGAGFFPGSGVEAAGAFGTFAAGFVAFFAAGDCPGSAAPFCCVRFAAALWTFDAAV